MNASGVASWVASYFLQYPPAPLYAHDSVREREREREREMRWDRERVCTEVCGWGTCSFFRRPLPHFNVVWQACPFQYYSILHTHNGCTWCSETASYRATGIKAIECHQTSLLTLPGNHCSAGIYGDILYLKVGTPLSALMPAPESTTMFLAFARTSRNAFMSLDGPPLDSEAITAYVIDSGTR